MLFQARPLPNQRTPDQVVQPQILSVTIKHGVRINIFKKLQNKENIQKLEGNQTMIDAFKAETCARKRGQCKICRRAIKRRDYIIGVYINGKGNEWDCRKM